MSRYAAPRIETRTDSFERERFDVWNEVPLVPQTTGMSCWAAAAAMLVGWRDRVPVNPRAVASGAGRWAAYREGLEPDDVPSLARAWGLHTEPATMLTIPRVRELLEHNGPLWLGEASPGLHSLVVTGIYGDGSPERTYVRVNDPWPIDRGERYVLPYCDLQRNFDAATLAVGDHVQLLHSGGRGHGARRSERSIERRTSSIAVAVDDRDSRDASSHTDAHSYGAVAAGERSYDTSTWRSDPLASHGGSGANLGMRWNSIDGPAALGGSPERVDVIVHFHGDSPLEPSARLLATKLEQSGVSLGGRERPTLGLIPRGRLIDHHDHHDHGPHEYGFPALLADDGAGLEALITASLARWSEELGIREPPQVALARLIFTANSRRGAATIERLLAHRSTQRVCNPEELHLFGSPARPSNILAWAGERIAIDRINHTTRAAMLSHGGALRIVCGSDSQAAEPSAEQLAAMIGDSTLLREFYRVEHVDFGGVLLRDAGADLDPTARALQPAGLSYGTPMGLFRRLSGAPPRGAAAEALRRQNHASALAKTPTNYDRSKAIAYALFFCNRVCSDGIVMSGTHSNRRPAGDLLTEIDPVDDENDCTHFISCSVGQPPQFQTSNGTTLTGGGVFLDPAGFYRSGSTGVYGMLQPSPLVDYLRLTRKIAFARIDANGDLFFDAQTPQFFPNTAPQVAQLKQLVQRRFPADGGSGDVIAYFSEPHGTGQHSALLVNDDWGIACHTGSRCGSQPITDVGRPYFIYLRFKQFKEDVL